MKPQQQSARTTPEPAASAAVDVLAIDGPGGAGKGTLASRCAAHLGWHLLDSGALYRVVGLAADRRGVALDDAAALGALARSLDIDFDGAALFVDGVDEAASIRAPQIDALASRVAAQPAVRRVLLRLQRGRRRAPGLVADGRDMGTVVFPDARLKIFLTASAEARARRRHRQLSAPRTGANGRLKGAVPGVSLRTLLDGIRERDERDRKRAVSPLVPASDAVRIDSTELTIDEVAEQVLRLAAARGMGPAP